MRRQLEKAGFTSDDLDSMVHEAASDMATNANNGGMKSQIEFLNQAGFTDKRIWAGVLIDMLMPGMSVDVVEPKHDGSPHSCSFTGDVVKVCDDYVCVRDMEDNHWDISFDEIENYGLNDYK
ncbi:hypothetical protein N9M08_07835 [Porticoccaceae bacterium]|nr:hypothetical protein [Porticoccaceae bacterium]MDA8682430.1 hypothetical protein [Porticoccaceae bacterium]